MILFTVLLAVFLGITICMIKDCHMWNINKKRLKDKLKSAVQVNTREDLYQKIKGPVELEIKRIKAQITSRIKHKKIKTFNYYKNKSKDIIVIFIMRLLFKIQNREDGAHNVRLCTTNTF